MSVFTGPLSISFHGNGDGRLATLNQALVWEMDKEGSGKIVTIPVGFRSDGATVPWWLWWFMPPWGDRGSRAVILHDYLRWRIFTGNPHPLCKTWKNADWQFFLALIACGHSKWKATVLWLGVRFFTRWMIARGTIESKV